MFAKENLRVDVTYLKFFAGQIDFKINMHGNSFAHTVSRDDFELVCNDLFDSIQMIIQMTVQRAELQEDDRGSTIIVQSIQHRNFLQQCRCATLSGRWSADCIVCNAFDASVIATTFFVWSQPTEQQLERTDTQNRHIQFQQTASFCRAKRLSQFSSKCWKINNLRLSILDYRSSSLQDKFLKLVKKLHDFLSVVCWISKRLKIRGHQ